MGTRKSTINPRQLVPAIIMLLALAWLTVSLPYVYKAQQELNQLTHQGSNAIDDSNPFSGTTEEKNESGTSLLSEYLHDITEIEHHFIVLPSFYKCHPSDLYLAYHPELVIPPPEA